MPGLNIVATISRTHLFFSAFAATNHSDGTVGATPGATISNTATVDTTADDTGHTVYAAANLNGCNRALHSR